jgi:hypothetical protein
VGCPKRQVSQTPKDAWRRRVFIAVKKGTGMPKPKSTKMLKGLTLDENATLLYYGFPVKEMLAYPVPLAAKLIGKGRSTLYKEGQRGKVVVGESGLISRAELERYAVSQGLSLPIPPAKKTTSSKAVNNVSP